ncbi:MAG: hypothetical protein AABX66_00400 [Nanoarchaeota archaeon]
MIRTLSPLAKYHPAGRLEVHTWPGNIGSDAQLKTWADNLERKDPDGILGQIIMAQFNYQAQSSQYNALDKLFKEYLAVPEVQRADSKLNASFKARIQEIS